MKNIKLYTEEQIKQAIELARVNSFGSDFKRWITNSESDIIDKLTPIELPSEEDVKKSAEWLEGIERLAWREGAKWAINHIKQQENGK